MDNIVNKGTSNYSDYPSPKKTFIKIKTKFITSNKDKQLPANVAAAANPAAVYGSVPGGAALIIYGFGTNAAGARPAENTPAIFKRVRNNKRKCKAFLH